MTDTFPPLQDTVYFNTAYVGLMPKSLLEFRQKQDQNYFLQGDQYKINAYETLAAKTTQVGAFFGASPQNTLLVSNFSESIRLALSFLPKAKRALVFEEDYPSLTSAMKEAGLDVMQMPISANLEDTIADAVKKHKIDVLALSVVQYISGLEIDQQFLKELKKQYPQLLIIGDGTQYLGTANFNFNNSPFDVLAASGYKWLMAGFGNGVLFLSDHYLDEIQKSYEQIAERFYVGHFNILATASLAEAISYIKKTGFSEMIARKDELTVQLKEHLLELGLLSSWVSQRKKHSSIFAIPDQEGLFEKMKKNTISCAQRGGYIRLSLHYYNSEKDIEFLVDFLKKNML